MPKKKKWQNVKCSPVSDCCPEEQNNKKKSDEMSLSKVLVISQKLIKEKFKARS